MNRCDCQMCRIQCSPWWQGNGNQKLHRQLLRAIGCAENGNSAKREQSLGCGYGITSSRFVQRVGRRPKFKMASPSIPPLFGKDLMRLSKHIRAWPRRQVADNSGFDINRSSI